MFYPHLTRFAPLLAVAALASGHRASANARPGRSPRLRRLPTHTP